MKKIILILLVLPIFAIGQDIPKKTNTIIVQGSTLSQCVNALLDAGYRIEKSDTTYRIVSTDFLNMPLKNGKESLVDMAIDVRVKDSAAYITGRWYSRLALTHAFGSDGHPGPNDIQKIKLTNWPAEKTLFMKLNDFALSLKGQVSYAIK